MSSSSLKLIAIITMFIDHIGYTFFSYQNEKYFFLRLIGRVSFPIFIFLISEGLIHTRNQKMYFKRLMIFAFISEIPYDLCFSFNSNLPITSQLFNLFQYQNVFFTLALGVLFVITIEDFKNNKIIYNLIVTVLLLLVSYFLKSDYGILGILFIPSMFFGEKKFQKYLKHPRLYIIFIFMFFITYSVGYRVFLASLVSIPIIYFYNGKVGKFNSKAFYYFYPSHFLILFFINNFIN